MKTRYTFGKTVAGAFNQTIERVTQALAKEGFGVLSDIDVAATLKKKVGIDMPPYRILGACNPQFAQLALAAEPQIGALSQTRFGEEWTACLPRCELDLSAAAGISWPG